jgi:hypothetical protein
MHPTRVPARRRQESSSKSAPPFTILLSVAQEDELKGPAQGPLQEGHDHEVARLGFHGPRRLRHPTEPAWAPRCNRSKRPTPVPSIRVFGTDRLLSRDPLVDRMPVVVSDLSRYDSCQHSLTEVEEVSDWLLLI